VKWDVFKSCFPFKFDDSSILRRDDFKSFYDPKFDVSSVVNLHLKFHYELY